jgi:XTP/dITP diphosphohydrolase
LGRRMKLLIATHNSGKLSEFRQIFATLPLELVSLDDLGISWEVDETGETFEANARLKAERFFAATGLATLADDSGLEVDALGGAPGVYSARYGGTNLTPRQQYELVLEQMRAVSPDRPATPGRGHDRAEVLRTSADRRSARYYCVIALAMPGKPLQVVDGECSGVIATEARGSGGFGYDPIFWLPEYGCTMAELPAETKNRISHRARAAHKARELLGS